VNAPVICIAPQYVAGEVLRAEGFTDIRYVAAPRLGSGDYLVSGEVGFSLEVPWDLVTKIDAGEPITVLSGVILGCYELFGNEGVRGIADLKGKSFGTQGAGSTRIGLPTLPAASVGLDPAKDINWVTDPSRKPWREYDAEDTVRFYTLRMHEVGFIKSSPKKIIAEGTDWRFLNELKRELKT
jgi:NitT/TauT family transport system substrate-binding protein